MTGRPLERNSPGNLKIGSVRLRVGGVLVLVRRNARLELECADMGFKAAGARRLFVFSHPNHELAVFGLLQQFKPHIVYLTDGGGEERVTQTKQGLARVGLAEHAEFLNYPEDAFYDRLLEQDVAYFEEIAARVADVVRRVQPSAVFCDAIEYYNPVHDLSVPIVRAALREHPHIELYELPLVYQELSEGEDYGVQQPSPTKAAAATWYEMTPEQLANKLHGRDVVYSILRDQMGGVICDLPPEALAKEAYVPAVKALPVIDSAHVVLRYEWRADLLLKQGAIEKKITHDEHYAPIARALIDS